MAYTAKLNSSGTYDVFSDGTKVTTGSAAILPNYGLSSDKLSSSVSAPTGIGSQTTGQAAAPTSGVSWASVNETPTTPTSSIPSQFQPGGIGPKGDPLTTAGSAENQTMNNINRYNQLNGTNLTMADVIVPRDYGAGTPQAGTFQLRSGFLPSDGTTIANPEVVTPTTGQAQTEAAQQTVDTQGKSTKITPTAPAKTQTQQGTDQSSGEQTLPDVPTIALQPGNTGEAVKRLQDYLVAIGAMTQAQVNTGYGTYGPQTQAAVAKLQATLGVDNSTGVGYFGPRTIAALQSQTNQLASQKQKQSGGTTAGASYTGQTGQPSLPQTANGNTPTQNVIETYGRVYKELGLSDVKAQYEKTLKEQQDLQNELNDKIADIRANPWLSQGVADKQVERMKEKYATRLDTLSHFAQLYDSIYKEGQQQVQFLVGQIEQDTRQAMDLAQKRQDALDALSVDNQVVEANGRQLLVNKATGTIVADLGAARPVSSGSGTGTSNVLTDNERALFGQFNSDPIVKDYKTILAKKLSFDQIINGRIGGPSDLALVFEFMRGLDPNSVVRETEYERAAQSGNIFAGYLAKFNGYLKPNGGFLPAAVRSEFQQIVNSKLKVQEDLYQQTVRQYQDMALRQGLNPSNVTVGYNYDQGTDQEYFTPGSIVVDDETHTQYLIGPDGVTKIPIGSAL